MCIYTLSFFFIGDDNNVFYFEPTISKSHSALYFRRSFDYEQKNSYQLKIQAKNMQYIGKADTTRKNMHIIIVNRNDIKPKFITQTEEYEVRENTKVGTHICRLTAIDPDKKHSIRYELVDTLYSQLFKINVNTGDVKVAGRINYEEVQEIYLIVTASDGTYTTNKQLKISVTDVNDNRPFFLQLQYNTSISSAMKPGSHILQLKALDKDSNAFGRISFTIETPNMMDYFSISGSNIILIKTIGKQKFFNFLVKAVDGGNQVSESSADITVNIIQEESSPRFSRNFYQVDIREGLQINTKILHLELDLFGFSTDNVRYSINEFGIADQMFFKIDENANIFVKKTIDYERTKVFYLVAKACIKKTNKENCGIAHVTVNVRDANDNRPIFTKSVYQETITEENLNSMVTKVTATDKDSNKNGAIIYKLHNFNDVFRLTELTGELYLNKNVNLTLKSYELRVEARDKGVPPLTSSCLIMLDIMLSNVTGNSLEMIILDTITNWKVILPSCAALLLVIFLLLAVVCYYKYRR